MLEGLFQPMHIIVIAIIAMLFLGPRRLPELGKGIGEGIRSFKESLREARPHPGLESGSEPKVPGRQGTV